MKVWLSLLEKQNRFEVFTKIVILSELNHVHLVQISIKIDVLIGLYTNTESQIQLTDYNTYTRFNQNRKIVNGVLVDILLSFFFNI